MKGYVSRYLYYLFLIAISVFVHALIFWLPKCLIPDSKYRHSTDALVKSTCSVSVEVQKPEKNTLTKKSKPITEKHMQQADTKLMPVPDRYKLGVFTKEEKESEESYAGITSSKGLPNLRFYYGGTWLAVCHGLFKEVDIIYHPSRSTFVVIDWQDGEPVFSLVSGSSVRDFILSRPMLFKDKVKNRRDEFDEFEPLKSVLENVHRLYFADFPCNDLFFVGVMPKEEIRMILMELHRTEIQDKQIREVNVEYVRNANGVKLVLKPVS